MKCATPCQLSKVAWVKGSFEIMRGHEAEQCFNFRFILSVMPRAECLWPKISYSWICWKLHVAEVRSSVVGVATWVDSSYRLQLLFGLVFVSSMARPEGQRAMKGNAQQFFNAADWYHVIPVFSCSGAVLMRCWDGVDCRQKDVALPCHASPTLSAFPRIRSRNCVFHPIQPRMERNLWGRSWLSAFKKPLLRSAIERYFAEEWGEREACNGPPFEVVDMSLSAESKRLKYLGNGVGSTKSLLFLIPTM